MNRSPTALRVLICALLAASASTAYAAASGNVKFRDVPWNVADGIAYAKDDETLVVLGSAPFDRKAFAEDGKLDDFDFMRQDNLKTLTLKIKADGTMNCFDFSTGAGGGSSCGSAGDGLKLTARTPQNVAGGQVEARTKADALTKSRRSWRAGAAVRPAARSARPDGRQAAIRSGTSSRQPARSRRDRGVGEVRQAKDMLEMMKMMTLAITKVTGGNADGDDATLD
jgi:hypothetical protein